LLVVAVAVLVTAVAAVLADSVQVWLVNRLVEDLLQKPHYKQFLGTTTQLQLVLAEAEAAMAEAAMAVILSLDLLHQ
jgi:hypothetical protein